MNARNDGGPAFPVVGQEWNSGAEEWRIASTGGMSLRDYFAAKALPACLSDYASDARIKGWDENWKMGVALDAYAMADAMLRARAEG